MARIVAVVTVRDEPVAGGAPIFFAGSESELGHMANLLEKVLDCAAHQIHGRLYVIVDRKRH